ncbi:hypothetical protein Gotur_027195 [Gossypium turneri]
MIYSGVCEKSAAKRLEL